MKILVTGGSGFIGSHLVDVLLEQNHSVLIYDLAPPRFNQDCGYVQADVTDLDSLIKYSDGYEIIYHLAAEANVNRFFDNPIYSNSITSSSTLNVLEAARQNKVRRVLLASTEWIYGSVQGNDSEQITEETPFAQNPDHLYTSSKIAAELFCKNYKRLYDVNYTIMRYGIPFGERARPETVTPIFIHKILNNEEITIHGDGSQTRQFIYVRDLAMGNSLCLKPDAENQVFNINGSEVISVIEIVRTLEELLGKKTKLLFVDDRKGNYKGRFISSQKAKKFLGWVPEWTYRNALEKYLSVYLQEMN